MLGFLATSVSRPASCVKHLSVATAHTHGILGSGVVLCCQEHVVRVRTFPAVHHGLGLECAAEASCETAALRTPRTQKVWTGAKDTCTRLS